MRFAPGSPQPVVVFTGAFGSGKTEVAVNYARSARLAGLPTCIVDLDVVTPYFRVGNLRAELQQAGLQVVAPEGSLASFELPSLPPEIAGALAEPSLHVVVDVGGDPVGARLLRVYRERISARSHELWLVVNPFRPSAATPEAVAEQARVIEAEAGLHITGIVANPNLGMATRPSDVRRGLETIQRAAEQLAVPVVLLAIARHVAEPEPLPSLPFLRLELVLRLPWESV